MSVEAQRIRAKAAEVREERARRTTKPYDASLDDGETDVGEPNPDEAATVRTPVETPADRVARTEGVSTMRTVSDMEGLDAIAEPVRRLGFELGQQGVERIQEWIEPIREEFIAATGEPGKAPRGFVFGSLYGAALALAGMIVALFVARSDRK